MRNFHDPGVGHVFPDRLVDRVFLFAGLLMLFPCRHFAGHLLVLLDPLIDRYLTFAGFPLVLDVLNFALLCGPFGDQNGPFDFPPFAGWLWTWSACVCT